MRLEQLGNASDGELNSELKSSEKARIAVTALFLTSLVALARITFTELPDGVETLADKLKIAGIAAGAYTTYLMSFAWGGSRGRSNVIIQEADRRSLPVSGYLIRGIETSQEAA